MAQYKDVEGYRKLFDEEYKKTRKLIFQGETHLDNIAEGFSEASRVIDSIPTADVVPKSEVENYKQIAETQQKLSMDRYFEIKELKEDIERLKDDNEYLQDKVFKVRLEVAREIFEEIEEIILDNTYPDFNREHKPVNIWKATTGYDAFYELKKKYTEENVPK